jgi:peptidoglycan/LPS O-acetylase OafA/YrhL
VSPERIEPISPPPKESTSVESDERVVALDGLRGIAASMVVITHAISALAKPLSAILALHHSPVALLSNGGGGVHIFFVLSGFCLAGSAGRALNLLGLVRFYLRRVLRIHPPYVVGLLISWLLSGWIYDRSAPVDALSQAMIDLRRIHISPRALQHALMFPGRAFVQLPVGWTLQVEAVFSILLPALMLIATRAHWLLLVAISLPMLEIKEETSLDYLRFGLDFSFGIAIFCERDSLSRLFASIPGAVRGLLLVTGILLLTSPVYYMIDMDSPVRALVLYCCGAAIIVMCVVHMPGVRRFLSRPALGWIGRMSFSVYLIHAPIIILLTPYVGHQLNFFEGFLFVAVSLLATYAIAPLLYYGVEEPSIRAGYWASAKLETLGRTRLDDRP